MVRTHRRHDAYSDSGVAGAWRECDFNQEQENNPGGRTDPTASEGQLLEGRRKGLSAPASISILLIKIAYCVA